MPERKTRSSRPGNRSTVVAKQVWPIEAFALLLLVIFTTELAVMEIFDPLFKQLGTVGAAVADATLLVVISAIPLKIVFSPVFASRLHHDEVARRALVVAFSQLVCGFFLIELLVMLFLPDMLSGSDPVLLGLADAGLTALLTAPLLWWLLIRLERSHHRVTLADLLESPLLLYLLLLYVVFLSDLLQELIIPDAFTSKLHGPLHLIDALLLTLIIAPFLWLFVARPLRRSIQSERARARAVYEQVIDAVVMVDTEGRVTALNPATQRIFGYTEAELVGRPVEGLFAAQRQGLKSLIQAVMDNETSGSEVSREMSGQHCNGGILTLDVSVSRILLGGRESFLLIMRDISERKDAERALRESDLRFRQMYEQSEDAILFFKPGSSYIVDVNVTAEQMFGYGKGEVLGHGMERLFRGEDLVRVRAAIDGLRMEKPAQLENVAVLRSDGSECLVTLRAKVMSLQSVELIYCTLRDITDRVRMEQEARDIQARLIQANKMTSLGLLVSGVAHEVNNPNNLIMTNAQLLAGGMADNIRVLQEYYRENGDFLLGGIPFSELDSHVPQLVNGIIDGSQRIAKIIADLKNYARTDPHGLDNAVDVNQVATASISILQHELARATERFHCDLAGNLPTVVGNSQQLGQVVINLLMNACQALPSRRHGIRLATAFDPAACQVVLTVADEGVGIAPEDGRRIMDPFFTTRLDRGGTGLGLSICRSIVTEHQGVLEFFSTPGNGTTFTVKIPAHIPAVRESDQ